MIKVLFISRRSERCGVADFGRRVYEIIKRSTVLDVTFREVDCLSNCNANGFDIVLYNYHYATLPFIIDGCLDATIKHIAIYHEAHLNFTPDKVIDTSIRPLFENIPHVPVVNEQPVISSFGFGFPDKDFPRIAQMVRDQFEKATLRLNIPFAEFGDAYGLLALEEVAKVRVVLAGSNITLKVDHRFMSHAELLTFLAQSDLNLFLYKPSHGRGISSAIDYALSVRRPIGISSSEMFRHLPSEICVDKISLPDLIKTGINLLRPVYEQHSNERLIKHYETLLTETCGTY